MEFTIKAKLVETYSQKNELIKVCLFDSLEKEILYVYQWDNDWYISKILTELSIENGKMNYIFYLFNYATSTIYKLQVPISLKMQMFEMKIRVMTAILECRIHTPCQEFNVYLEKNKSGN